MYVILISFSYPHLIHLSSLLSLSKNTLSICGQSQNSNVQVAMTPEARSAALDAIPMNRFGTAAEIADAALFLAANKYANNCVLNLDGGLSAM
jgi:NAD(P)-dependent dehydrogenase (short-subunit alcohol dehydrogenase family)